MSFIAVATIGSSVIGAGASLIGSGEAASAQRDAASQSTAVQEQQLAQEQAQYDQNRADLAPYRDAGYTALGQLAAGTAAGGEFNTPYTAADFATDPGYQFRLDQGNRGVEASAAARGGVLSGGTLKALAAYNSGEASQEYNSAYNRYQNDLTARYNRLAGVAGTGQTATNTGISAGEALSNQQQTGVNNITSNIAAAGNATASQYAAGANAIGNAANNVGQYYSLSSFLNPSSTSYGAGYQNQPYTPPSNGVSYTASDYGF